MMSSIVSLSLILIIVRSLSQTCAGLERPQELTDKEAKFLSSIYLNDTTSVKSFIRDDGNVNVVNNDGLTALHIAAMHDYYEILVVLLNAGANVNALTIPHDLTALVLAAINGNVQIINALLLAGSDVNLASQSGSALQFALLRKNWEAAIVLSLAGAGDGKCTDNIVAVLQRSVEKGYGDLTRFLLDRKYVDVNVELDHGENILIHAVKRNDRNLVEYLIRQGGDVNAASKPDGVTSLHVAAMNDYADIIHLLLDAGAKVNVADRHSITALRWTFVYNHVRVANILLLANATIEENLYSEASQNTLHWLSYKNYHEIAGMFLQMADYIDINRKMSADGLTALHVACLHNHYDMALVLIANGASVDITDNYDQTPHRYAIEYGHGDLALLLKANGANAVETNDGTAVQTLPSSDVEVMKSTQPHAYINPDLSLYNLSDAMAF